MSSWKELQNLMKYSKSLDYGDEIDFDKCRSFFSAVLPRGNSLALKKVKTRKSFVKLEKPKISISREPSPTPKKRTAAKSLKRTVVEETSQESDDEVQVSVRQVRKQPKRATNTPAKSTPAKPTPARKTRLIQF